MDYLKIHKNFKLQGLSFSSEEDLIRFSKSVSEELALFLLEWFNEKTYVKVSTSGSTGNPKLIKLQKKSMINSAKATGEFFGLSENSTALLCLPINYIAGKMMIVRALVLGWQLDYIISTSQPLKNINKQYNFCAMVPLQLLNSIDKLEKINILIVGGGAITKVLLEAVKSLKTQIFATYGMTETCTHIALKKLNNFSEKSNEKSHYKTLPSVSISKDKKDCLIIDAPKISEKLIYTNDIVEIYSENEFDWLGRFDNIINSGGIKLVPEQIETKLETLIKERFFVAGLPDPVFGTKLVLLVESAENYKAKNDLFEEIRNLKSLSKFEIPKQIFFIDKFKNAKNHKTNRKDTLKIISK